MTTSRKRAPAKPAATAPVGPVAAGVPDLPLTTPAEPLAGLVVLARSGNDQVAPLATARAAGVPVHVLRTPDPRGSGELVTALSSAPQEKVLALGAGFGTVEQLQQRLAVVRTGVQLPGGGQLAVMGTGLVRDLDPLAGDPATQQRQGGGGEDDGFHGGLLVSAILPA